MEIEHMETEIQKWLEKFRKNWKDQQVGKVLNLFTDDVDYYETPDKKLECKEEIRKEWQNVKQQKDIQIETEMFSKDGNKYTVKWHLEYTQNSERKVLYGIYLIELNEENRCKEFWQYCQAE